MLALKTDVKDDIKNLKTDIDRQFGEVSRQFGEVNRRLTLIEADQKQFFTITGKMDGRIDEISRR